MAENNDKGYTEAEIRAAEKILKLMCPPGLNEKIRTEENVVIILNPNTDKKKIMQSSG